MKRRTPRRKRRKRRRGGKVREGGQHVEEREMHIFYRLLPLGRSIYIKSRNKDKKKPGSVFSHA